MLETIHLLRFFRAYRKGREGLSQGELLKRELLLIGAALLVIIAFAALSILLISYFLK